MHEKLRVARFIVTKEPKFRYMSTAVLRLVLIEDRSCYVEAFKQGSTEGAKVLVPTMKVDGRGRLYYHPDFVEAMPVKNLAALLVHEAWHVLRFHSARAVAVGAATDEELRRIFNLACDLAINDGLSDLPEGAVYPHTYNLPDGQLEEWYYKELLKRRQNGQGDPKPENGYGLASGNCGPGADGSEGSGKSKGGESDQDPRGLSELEIKLLARHTAQRILEEARKSRGTVPGSVVRWAETALRPQVDWRKELIALVRNAIYRVAGRVDYSYMRPSRRQRATKVILPSMVDYRPNVAVVIDTSGSMGKDELGRALAELSGILRASTGRVWFLATDADVHVKKAISSIHQATLEGGGGTDMRVGIEAALEFKPDIVVVLTDGITPWPESKPKGVEVIACIIGDSNSDVPSWLRHVRVPIES